MLNSGGICKVSGSVQMLILKRKKKSYLKKLIIITSSEVAWLFWQCGSATWALNRHISMLDRGN